MDAAGLIEFLQRLENQLPAWQSELIGASLTTILKRLKYLIDVGLPYLSLGRPLRTLSDGEQQRVLMTSVLASNLVNMLYVLDEPSSGLHPANVNQLITAIEQLRDRRNTVIAVDHEPGLILAADWIVEFGPAPGTRADASSSRGRRVRCYEIRRA